MVRDATDGPRPVNPHAALSPDTKPFDHGWHGCHGFPVQPAPDPFRQARQESGVLQCPIHGENIAMILRHEDVRRAAKDWQTFSSDAPFRVPIPSEEDVRSMRQLPIETNPPEHTEYRKIADPFFQRPKDPAFIARVEALIGGMLTAAMSRDSVEIVNEFALPIQSRALTYLLNMPESEADLWIGWGIHVFKVTGGLKKGVALEEYLHAQFDRAVATPGEDFFSALTQATFRGRPLTREEMMGFANLAFAGGRDTIIHTISCALGYLASHPEDLEYLRQDPNRITHASEEFFRVFMPLTHIGRVCPADTNVNGVKVQAGDRVSLCWASANQDEKAGKSTFVSTMGKDQARQRAEMLVQQACRHLNVFEGRADTLKELAHYVLSRRS